MLSFVQQLRSVFLLGFLALSPLVVCGQTDQAAGWKRIERLHQTPNWQFITEPWIESVRQRSEQLQGPKMTLQGVVKDSQQQAVADACVVLRVASNNSYVPERRYVDGARITQPQDVFAVGWTNETGSFKFRNQATPWTEPTRPLRWEICIFAAGKSLEVRHFQAFDDRSRAEEFELVDEQQISGTVLDADGEPCPGVPIRVFEIVNPFREGGTYAQIEHSFLFSEMHSLVTTDANGRFHIGGLPSDRIVTCSPASFFKRNGLPRNFRVLTNANADATAFAPKEHPRASLVHPYYQSVFTIQSEKRLSEFERPKLPSIQRPPYSAEELRKITVRVVDATSRDPIQGVGVKWQDAGQSGHEGLRLNLADPSTNPAGVVEFLFPKKRDIAVAVLGRRFGYVTHFERFTTSLKEYTPDISPKDWGQVVARGDDDVELVFELQSIKPTRVMVVDSAGKPVVASVTIQPSWSDYYRMPTQETDASGGVSISIRPVLFDVKVVAETHDGKRGEAIAKLDKNFDIEQRIRVQVGMED